MINAVLLARLLLCCVFVYLCFYVVGWMRFVLFDVIGGAWFLITFVVWWLLLA